LIESVGLEVVAVVAVTGVEEEVEEGVMEDIAVEVTEGFGAEVVVVVVVAEEEEDRLVKTGSVLTRRKYRLWHEGGSSM
jgi:hypothetical protein